MIKGALFDLDGTLAETIVHWNQIIPNYIRGLGYDADDTALAGDIHALSMVDSAALIRETFHLAESPKAIVEAWRRQARHIYTDVAPLRENAKAVLEKLYRAGVPLVLVTNNDEVFANALLERTGVRHLFKALYCGYNLGLGKTEPTLIELARKAAGSAPKETLLFEDSLGPIRTGNALGIHTVAMLDKNHTAEEVALIRQEAQSVFEDYFAADHWLDALLHEE